MDDRHPEKVSLFVSRSYHNMKLELFRDGQLYLTIEAIGPGMGDDFEIIPKRLVKDSSLSAQSFKELFYSCMKESKTYVEAYEKAEEIHEKYFDKRRYSSYNSFRHS